MWPLGFPISPPHYHSSSCLKIIVKSLHRRLYAFFFLQSAYFLGSKALTCREAICPICHSPSVGNNVKRELMIALCKISPLSYLVKKKNLHREICYIHPYMLPNTNELENPWKKKLWNLSYRWHPGPVTESLGFPQSQLGIAISIEQATSALCNHYVNYKNYTLFKSAIKRLYGTKMRTVSQTFFFTLSNQVIMRLGKGTTRLFLLKDLHKVIIEPFAPMNSDGIWHFLHKG